MAAVALLCCKRRWLVSNQRAKGHKKSIEVIYSVSSFIQFESMSFEDKAGTNNSYHIKRKKHINKPFKWGMCLSSFFLETSTEITTYFIHKS